MKLFTRLLILIIALCLVLLLFSCGPTWHLKQAKKHLKIAEAKGAKVSMDTVYRDIITERTVTDTLVQFQEVRRLFTDTITVETTKWKTKTKIDTVTKKIFQQVECKPDTVRVPFEVLKIKAGHTTGQLIGAGLVFLVVGFLLSRIVWTK